MDKIRLIKDKDYPMLTLFWAMQGDACDARDLYPTHSSYVFERDGKLLYAVGVHKVEGIPVAYAEGLIRNPQAASDFNAVGALQAHIEQASKELGCKALAAIAKNPALEAHHAKLGYNKVQAVALMVKGV